MKATKREVFLLRGNRIRLALLPMDNKGLRMMNHIFFISEKSVLTGYLYTEFTSLWEIQVWR